VLQASGRSPQQARRSSADLVNRTRAFRHDPVTLFQAMSRCQTPGHGHSGGGPTRFHAVQDVVHLRTATESLFWHRLPRPAPSGVGPGLSSRRVACDAPSRALARTPSRRSTRLPVLQAPGRNPLVARRFAEDIVNRTRVYRVTPPGTGPLCVYARPDPAPPGSLYGRPASRSVVCHEYVAPPRRLAMTSPVATAAACAAALRAA